MALIVQKFGGSSVADAQRIMHVAGIVGRTHSAGNQVVVVVSAQGKTTDMLITKAQEISPAPSRRELDMLLATGEQVSIALLAMALSQLGYPVTSLTGWQAGVITDADHTRARVRRVESERLMNELAKNNIVIVAGFQGVNRYDDITTLGRGGSDTSAVALAAALRADKCQIYTDVDGIYTADPRLVADARKLKEITYDEMLELSALGAKVLHSRSVEMAKKYGVDLEVLSSLEDVPGTKLREATDVEKALIKGVVKDDNVARITVVGVPDRPGIAFRVFSLMAKRGISVDIILQSLGRDGAQDISFTVARSDADEALAALEEAKESMGFAGLDCDRDVCKVSIVGVGIAARSGVACTLFEALAEEGINILMISTSEIIISVLIEQRRGERAVQAIHEAFFN